MSQVMGGPFDSFVITYKVKIAIIVKQQALSTVISNLRFGICKVYLSLAGTNLRDSQRGKAHFSVFEVWIYKVYKKGLNKSEIAIRLCRALKCTKVFIEIGSYGTYNVQ